MKYNKLLLLVVEKENWWFIKCNKIEIINFYFSRRRIKKKQIYEETINLGKKLKVDLVFSIDFFSCCSESDLNTICRKNEIKFLSLFIFFILFFVGIESIFNFLAFGFWIKKIKNRISPPESTLS